MTINDLTPQERMLLFLMRLSDALPPPRVKPDIEEESSEESENHLRQRRGRGVIPGSILPLRLPLSGFTTVYTIFTQTAETLETQDFIDSLLQHFHYDLKFESLLLRQKFRESQGSRNFFKHFLSLLKVLILFLERLGARRGKKYQKELYLRSSSGCNSKGPARYRYDTFN